MPLYDPETLRNIYSAQHTALFQDVARLDRLNAQLLERMDAATEAQLR